MRLDGKNPDPACHAWRFVCRRPGRSGYRGPDGYRRLVASALRLAMPEVFVTGPRRGRRLPENDHGIVDLLLTMHAGFVRWRRVGSDYRRSERSRCLCTSRYADPCLRALSLGLSLASDPLAEKAEPPNAIVSMIEYLALELTDRSSPAAAAS